MPVSGVRSRLHLVAMSATISRALTLAALICAVSAGTALAQASRVPAGIPASPSYDVRRAPDAHADLLAADDGAWQRAQVISWGPAPYETRFRALWSPTGLYLRWDADDTAPWHTMTNRDDHLWEEEVVEIFLDPSWKGTGYWELEISPANVVCDVRMVDVYPNVTSDLTWDHEGLETRAREVPGPDGKPVRWVATAFAPWTGFAKLPVDAGVALPPRPGDVWGFNVFRIERPNGPAEPRKGNVSVAWSPTGKPSFHVPDAFRRFTFVGD